MTVPGHPAHHNRPAGMRRVTSIALTLAMALLLGLVTGARGATQLPPGFSETKVVEGLTFPTVTRFAPDGRVFVAEKSGLIKVYDGIADPTPTIFADLRSKVHDFWDRGMLGLALDPQFSSSRPYVYVLYTYDAPIGGAPPTWGDGCPNPPGATEEGCVVSARLSKLTAVGDVMTGAENVLINDWCAQYPSHTVGGLAFGPDGALYASGGDGASFLFVDYGQEGTPPNPCGDPPSGVGGTQVPPNAEGGALRSQDLRTPGDPVTLDGTVIRINPDTGAAMPGNPLAGHSDPNARRIVAQGLRNPFRIAFRPGTDELWVGDVGWTGREEISRIVNPTGSVKNFGWPCYEGSERQSGYDPADLAICEALYADAGAVTAPYFEYLHRQTITPGENCSTGSSSVTGLAFSTNASWPAAYGGGLFFADYSRNCIWVMSPGANGLPNPATVLAFAQGASQPIDLTTGPDGALYYTDFAGSVRRISYSGSNQAPTAVAVSLGTLSGGLPLQAAFDASESTDPDPGDTLTYAWDLDGDGAFDDSTAESPLYTYSSPGTYQVRLRVTDSGGLQSTSAPLSVNAGNAPPVATIDPPSPISAAWAVGDTITFSGSATDPESGALPASRLSWQVDLHHCGTTDPGSCHVHPLQTFDDVAGGDFPAPDHEYPSWIVLTLTATDGNGGSDTATLRLDPKTVGLTLNTQPQGGSISLGPNAHTAPHTAAVIAGSRNTVGTPSPQLFGTTTYTFGSWSDGGARTHDIVAPLSGSASYTAVFTPTTSACGPGELTAEYFDNATLAGAPVLTRCETAIDNDWGDGIPAPGLPANDFSVRWSGTPVFAAGDWRFTTVSDDGIRLLVDGTPVIDNWTDHGPTTDTGTRTLTAGAHAVVVEYYEKGGGSEARASWTPVTTGPTTCAPAELRAEYFTNKTLSGTPALVRCETAIDNDWGGGAPAPGIPANDFSVRWSTTRSFAGGVWTFTTRSDDGIRVRVDGDPVIDNWTDHGPTTDTGTATLTPGTHTVIVEYYEKNYGAEARASWELTTPGSGCPAGQYAAEYFDNPTLAGAPVLTRCETEIDNDWGDGIPAPGLPANDFSVRWTAAPTFTAGAWRFTTTSDDGIRLLVDGAPVIDNWTDHGPTTDTGTRTLTAGAHAVVVEYYEKGGGAEARASWMPEPVGPGACPAGQLRAEYFTNKTLSGTPALVRCETAIDNDWGTGAPAPGLPVNNFSVRWSGAPSFTAGTWTFTTHSDDGIRLMLDGNPVIDNWTDHGPVIDTGFRALTAGTHSIVVEYYENNGGSMAMASWTPGGG
jgi:glucose/arabinose dehydrogenase/PKD repeat protein